MERYINEFREYLRNEDKGAQTIRTYVSVLQSFGNWYVTTEGNFDPRKVTPVQLQDYRSYMVTVENKKPATVNKALATLKSFFGWLAETGHIDTDPALKVKMKRVQDAESPKWLTQHEQNRILDVLRAERNEWKQARDRAVIYTMLYAGLRIDEVSNLKLSDADCKLEMVTVRNGKGGKFRYVPMNPELKKALKVWLTHRETSDKPYHRDSEYLFLSERSDHMTTRAIGFTIDKHLIKCGLIEVSEGQYDNGNRKVSKERGQISSHSLRHTFCKNLVDRGIPIQQVARLAGHSSLEVTRRYVEPGQDELRKAINSL